MARLDDFVAGVAESGLVPRDRLRQIRDALPPGSAEAPEAPVRLARDLIARGLLTTYQARKILAGATRGFILGDYVILHRLGEGGMGKVYLARRQADGQKVALKVLPPRKQQEHALALDRFRREMELSRRVRHRYVARSFAMGEADGVWFMALEFVPGDTLFNLVKDPNRGPLRVPDAARFFIKVAGGLAAAHEAGLVHRDIKPANLMVTPEGDAKILDLGLARSVEEEGVLTRQNTILGTLDYASPEQLGDAAKADARSDLYSLGCTLYFALAGRPPFEGGDVVNKIFKHRMDDPEPLERVARGVPAAFAAIVRKLMAKEPGDRYPSARELANDLARWTDPATVRAILGTEAEAAVAFRPPPPQLEDEDLRLLDDTLDGPAGSAGSLRDLGDPAPKPAPMHKPPPPPRPAVPLGDDSDEADGALDPAGLDDPDDLIPTRRRTNPDDVWTTRLILGALVVGAVTLLVIAVLL